MRERLADWISGGALTRAKILEMSIEENRLMWRNRAFERNGEIGKLIDVLNRIAAQEKPTSNATVRRMARIARETLK